MVTKDRIQVIKRMVASDKKVTVSSLNGISWITEETIRRDLEKLESEGFLIRAHGGVALDTAMLTESIHFYKRASSFCEEKQFIARRAFPFIDNKTTMTTDSSSTVMGLLKLLQDRSDLTLLTNSVETIHVLAQSEIKVVSTGGKLNKNTLSLQGGVTKEIISRYHVDIMVMNHKSLDINSSTLDSNEAEAEIKKTMIRQATEVALLVNHSRLGRKVLIQLAGFSHINYIITDKSPSVEWTAFYKDNNVQLVW